MNNATYHTKDQNWTNGSTTYWFEMEGDLYGVVEGEGAGVVDSDGHPIDYNNDLLREVERACTVTDDMRAE